MTQEKNTIIDSNVQLDLENFLLREPKDFQKFSEIVKEGTNFLTPEQMDNVMKNIFDKNPNIFFNEEDIKKANQNFYTDGEHVYVNSDFMKKLISEEAVAHDKTISKNNTKNSILDLREQISQSNTIKNKNDLK